MRLGRWTSRRIVVVTIDHHGLRRPIHVQFLLLLSSLPSTASMTDRQGHNGPSRVFVQKHINSWNLGTRITSLNFMTNLQDGPLQPRRTVTSVVIPHLVRLPHLPLAVALRCHLRTVTSTTDRRKLHSPTLSQTFPSSFSNCTTLPPTDRHKNDEPSQAPQVVSSTFLSSKPRH